MNIETGQDNSTRHGARRWLLLLCPVMLLGAWWIGGVRQPPVEPMQPAGVADVGATDAPVQPSAVKSPLATPMQVNVSLPQPTPYARQLVRVISRQEGAGTSLTLEEAQEWKKSADALIQQGPAGVSAIMEFLEKNTDIPFGAEGMDLLGFRSAREALFDVLLQIGGAEGLSATLQVLHRTGDPREIALLAQNLEKLAPEQYRGEAVTAARNVLATVSKGKLPGKDVAPLFEVFQHYGGSEVVADLEQARARWEYYSTMSLAQLPDGAGIPSLIQMVQANGNGAVTALELLAQLSAGYAEARSALLEMARRNGISSTAWPYLVTALAGNAYQFSNSAFVGPQGRAHPGNISVAHIQAGNQTFYNAFNRESLTPDQFKERMGVIDELRAIISDPAGLDTIQQATDLLLSRQPMMAASP